ncbi:MAG: DUF2851 family protein [Flavobacteriaceae bacterium]
MQEDFLHHVWLHKKFALESLQTTENQPITIKSVGLPNANFKNSTRFSSLN